MSRGQQSGILSTAKGNSATDQENAASTFGDTQDAIGNYQKNLASFVSGNPYNPGGQYDQTINSGLSATSDAGSNSLKGALQSQALRTGQNSAADAATAATVADQNTRNLSSDMATAQQQRISGQTGYNTTALGASATPISAESGLYGTSLSGGNSALNTGEDAAKTPSFWDEVGSGLAGGLSKGVQVGATGGVGVCWIAAEIFGGWHDPRTCDVREWLITYYSKTFPGNVVVAIYRAIGKQVAWCVRRSRLLKWAITPLFNKALACARKA